MLRISVMPCLLLSDRRLVKSVKFKDHKYVGDPLNAIRIFNQSEIKDFADRGYEYATKYYTFEAVSKYMENVFKENSVIK